jgi:hypothetical protein
MTPLQADESSALSKGGMKERKTGSDRLSGWLEELYTRFNHREYVHPDPVELLYDFEDVREREIVALVAAALAYGRAALIVKNAGRIVDIMGTSPRAFVLNSSDEDLASIFRTFRHRFTQERMLRPLFPESGGPFICTEAWKTVFKRVAKAGGHPQKRPWLFSGKSSVLVCLVLAMPSSRTPPENRHAKGCTFF